MKRCEENEKSGCDKGQDQFWKTTDDLVKIEMKSAAKKRIARCGREGVFSQLDGIFILKDGPKRKGNKRSTFSVHNLIFPQLWSGLGRCLVKQSGARPARKPPAAVSRLS